MAQFESIAQGPLDEKGFMYAGSVSLGTQGVTDEQMTDANSVFVLQTDPQTLSASLFGLKPCSVLESELLDNIEVFDHLKDKS